jgi:hypothetical protein
VRAAEPSEVLDGREAAAVVRVKVEVVVEYRGSEVGAMGHGQSVGRDDEKRCRGASRGHVIIPQQIQPTSMRLAAARDAALNRALSLDDEQLEQLCKTVLERAERTRDLELTPLRGDGGINVHAVVDHDLFHVHLRIQAQRYVPSNTVGVRTVRSFKRALREGGYHVGPVTTTSSFTSGAEKSADGDNVRLVDGELLTTVMIEDEIGVTAVETGEYAPDEVFWAAFEQPETATGSPPLRSRRPTASMSSGPSCTRSSPAPTTNTKPPTT